MDSNLAELKLQQIPVLHVRGTHKEVGFAIGRTFKNFFHEVIKSYDFLEELLIPNYNSERGRKIYEASLTICRKKFPGYVEELEGLSIGSEIPFHKLFLLHIESQIVPSEANSAYEHEKLETGCSCLLSYPNKSTVLLGHTEDARKVLQNNIYILDAEIVNEFGEKLEKFTTLCYSCTLPGFTMGYNEHGLFHSMNSLVPSKVCPGKTPVEFLMRGLLGAKNLSEAKDILRDVGSGTADGFSVNFVYAPSGINPILQNIEIAPDLKLAGSRLDVHEVRLGESYAHCNKYIRMKIEQSDRVIGSQKRHDAIAKYKTPYDLESIKEILSDRTNQEYPVYRGLGHLGKEIGTASTVAVGIFDITNKRWFIYKGPPNASNPIAILPINLC